tara:strand:- start:3324 stop:4124 length:801 start_codon:yes stop_codon:yes gene_type:complete
LKILQPTHRKVKSLQWFLHLAIIPAIYYSTSTYWLMVLLTFWLMHGIGSGIGVHRYYVHNTFSTNKFWQIIFSFFFTISSTGSTVGYILMHLKHHANADTDKDPHNPKDRFFKTWWGVYDETKLVFGAKKYIQLLKDPINRFFHNYYFGIILVYVITLIIIDPILFVYLYAIPAIMQFHVNAILIALVHTPKYAKMVGGERRIETIDKSWNIPWLKPLLLGEEMHNNHHAQPHKATVSIEKSLKDFDPLYYIIKYIVRGKEVKYNY